MTVLQAWVAEDNQRAINFYKKVGFQEIEERQPHTSEPSKQIALLRNMIERNRIGQ